MEDEEHLWTTTEIVHVLSGLIKAQDALPWPLRFFMRGWTAALIAAGLAFAGPGYIDKYKDPG